MKKQELHRQIVELAEKLCGGLPSELAEAQARFDRAQRLLQLADDLLNRVELKYQEVERQISRGEKIEADYIDPAQTREALRFVALVIGVKETTPGRFVGGYEAIAKRIHELCDTEDKANLLTTFFNVTVLGLVRPDDPKRVRPIQLERDAPADAVRHYFVELTKDIAVPAPVRDRLNIAVSESRAVAAAVERAMRVAAEAAVSSLGFAAWVGKK